jgi:hypothetical protein
VSETVSLESNQAEAAIASELRRILKLRPVALIAAYMTEHEGEYTVHYTVDGGLDNLTACGLAHHLLQQVTWGSD